MILVALATAGALYLVARAARAPELPVAARSGAGLTLLPQPRPLHAISLVDHEGRAFGLERLRGAWTLLFFGFTSCPDVCPTTLVELGRLRRELLAHGEPLGALRLVFVSVDPGRDDQATLARYVRHFDPDLTGVSGEPAALAEFAAQLGAAFEVVDTGETDYPVYHSSAVFVIDPQARLGAVLHAPLDAARVAPALEALGGGAR